MKIFMTGATGCIGSTTTERLRAARPQIVALARSGAAA
jgi:nucleoside-diphosphate-sugar epimerase